MKYQTFSQTISYAPDFTVVNYWQKLPANLAQISATWGKRVHHTQYSHLAGPFSILWQNLRPAVVAHNQEKPHTTPYYSLIFISLLYFKTNEPCKTGAFCIFNLPDFSSRFHGRFLWRPCCHLIRGGRGPPACGRPPCWPCCGPGWPPGSQGRTPAPVHQIRTSVLWLNGLILNYQWAIPRLYFSFLIPINQILKYPWDSASSITNELSFPNELYYSLLPISCHFLKSKIPSLKLSVILC